MAYCSRCGAKMEDGATFCPSCGTQVNAVNKQTNPATYSHNMSDMGELIVSTKIGAKMKSVLTVCCVFEVILGIFMFCSIGILQKIFDSSFGGFMLGFILGCSALFYPVFIIIGHRSYCDVHENGVVGMTGLSLSNPNAPMQKFSIAYSEITNITESAKTLIIYTQYATYEVLAREHRKEALMEIRNRMV